MPTLFTILYWIILILAALGIWAPAPWGKLNSGSLIVLLILLGIRVFPIALH